MFGIARSHFDAAFGDAQGARAVFQSADTKPFLRQLESFALFSDEVFHRDFHVVEGDLPGLLAHHGLELGDKREPWRFHVDHETRNAPVGGLRRISDSHELAKVGVSEVSVALSVPGNDPTETLAALRALAPD